MTTTTHNRVEMVKSFFSIFSVAGRNVATHVREQDEEKVIYTNPTNKQKYRM